VVTTAFLSLALPERRQQGHVLPMPAGGVIAIVKHMAQVEQQPLIGYGVPLFEWGPGVVAIEDKRVIT